MAAGPDKLALRLGTLRSTHDHALLPENYELRAETERLKSRVQQSLQSEDSASPQEASRPAAGTRRRMAPLFHSAIPPTYHAPAPLRQARRPLPPRPSRFGVR
jgi:hypothetical protein